MVVVEYGWLLGDSGDSNGESNTGIAKGLNSEHYFFPPLPPPPTILFKPTTLPMFSAQATPSKHVHELSLITIQYTPFTHSYPLTNLILSVSAC